MIRTSRLALVLLAALILCALTSATNAQHVERGILFQPGETLVTELSPAGDVDTYVFYGAAGAEVSFTLRPLTSGLSPTMSLRDENGAALPVAAYTKTSGSKTKIRRYPLPYSGPFFVRVTDPLGRSGKYRLATKGKLDRVPAHPTVTIGPGETHEVKFGAGPGRLVDVKIKLKKGASKLSVLSVHDPAGEEVPHGVASFLDFGRKLRATLRMRSPARSLWRDDTDPRRLGEYGLVIGGATVPSRFTVKVKVRHPKVKGTRVVASTLPTIARVEPDFGRPGADLVIHGADFLPGRIAVLFGGTRGLEPTFLTPSTIAVRAPAGTGLVDVTVLNGDGQEGTLEEGFQFIPNPPSIASVSPTEGPDSGGTALDIFGKNMSHVETVTIGSTVLSGTPTVMADFQVRVTTEPMAPGTYPVRVTDRFGQSFVIPDAFTFVPAPVLLAVSPSSGGGGRTVTCLGQNFRPDMSLHVNGVETAMTYVSASTLTWVTPPGVPGDKLTVTVEDPWGRTSTLVDAYEYRLSTGMIDETFASNDHEDTAFSPTGIAGLARWNAVATPGMLMSTYGASRVNAPFTPAQSTSANSFPLGTYNSGALRVSNWIKASEIGSAGTVSGLHWVPSSSYGSGTTLGKFTILMGHSNSTTGLTSTTHLSNFSGTPTTVVNDVTYTVPTQTASSPCAFPAFTSSFSFNGTSAVVIDVQKQTVSGSISAWKYRGDTSGRRLYQNSGVGPTGTNIDSSAYCYYLDFRTETSMARSQFYRVASDLPTFLAPIVDPTSHPAGTEVTIEYQAAQEDSGTGDPDPLTYSAWTEDPTTLSNHRYLRFRVTFKANLVTSVGPFLSRITIPYTYFD